jgi:deoxycytidylate deaminase
MQQFKYQRVVDNLAAVARANPPVSSVRVAAALVYKNRIVSYGVNSYKTSPLQKKYGKNEHAIFLHAEISAIKHALRQLTLDQLSRSNLIICRVNHTGMAMSKPCVGCQRAIAQFGIRKVFYTTETGVQQMEF